MPPKRKQKRAQRKHAEEPDTGNSGNTEGEQASPEEASEDTAMTSPPQTRHQQQSSSNKSASASSSAHKSSHKEEHHSQSVRRSSTTTTTSRRGHSLGPSSASRFQGRLSSGSAEGSGSAERRRSSMGNLRGRTPTPHKPSRAKEQQDLQHLNSRLENYGKWTGTPLRLWCLNPIIFLFL